MFKNLTNIGINISLGLIIFGFILTSPTLADSVIKRWKSQTVYVPIYSHIFSGGVDNRPLYLSANLIVRNTDAENPINISRIDYYNSNGDLIKQYLDTPRVLRPLGSAYYLVQTSDKSGGWGANFVIEWESAKFITEPLIEAIHSGALGTHSYSFSNAGKAIEGVHE